MFLRAKKRFKDGKEHRYWSIVENRRLPSGKVSQRQVLYLGEINDSQKVGWCKAIDVLDDQHNRATQLALFPDDREAPELACETIQLRLSDLSLHRPRQWGSCWLGISLWDQLQLDSFWSECLPVSRKGTKWLNVLKTLVTYRLISPGSECACTENGSATAPWPICWEKMMRFCKKISCTDVWINLLTTNVIFSVSSPIVGTNCSTSNSMFCCMTSPTPILSVTRQGGKEKILVQP